MTKQKKAKQIGISPKKPKRSRMSILIPKKKSKEKQIKAIKKHLNGMGITDGIFKLDFTKFVSSERDYSTNLESILDEVDKLRLVEKGAQPYYWLLKHKQSDKHIAEQMNNQVELNLYQEELRNKFNDEEGFVFSKPDFEMLLFTCGCLLTSPKPANLKVRVRSEDSKKVEPFIPSPDHSNMRKLIDMLKSNKKPPTKPSVLQNTTGKGLNINS